MKYILHSFQVQSPASPAQPRSVSSLPCTPGDDFHGKIMGKPMENPWMFMAK